MLNVVANVLECVSTPSTIGILFYLPTYLPPILVGGKRDFEDRGVRREKVNNTSYIHDPVHLPQKGSVMYISVPIYWYFSMICFLITFAPMIFHPCFKSFLTLSEIILSKNKCRSIRATFCLTLRHLKPRPLSLSFSYLLSFLVLKGKKEKRKKKGGIDIDRHN